MESLGNFFLVHGYGKDHQVGDFHLQRHPVFPFLLRCHPESHQGLPFHLPRHSAGHILLRCQPATRQGLPFHYAQVLVICRTEENLHVDVRL